MPSETMQKSKRSRRQWYWPQITDAETAGAASNSAAGLASFQACATLIILVLNQTHVTDNLLGIDLWNLADVALLSFTALFVYKKRSRSAAVILLVYYCASAIISFYDSPSGLNQHHPNIVMMAIFVLGYISGVRGTFAYHSYINTNRHALLTDQGAI